MDNSTMTSSNSGITHYMVVAGGITYTYYARSEGDRLEVLENTMSEDMLKTVMKVTGLFGKENSNARGKGTTRAERNAVNSALELDQSDV